MTKKYTRLTIEERKSIHQLYNAGKSIRFIATCLVRNPSSISRELHRGGKSPSEYQYHWAQRNANTLKDRNRRKAKITGELEAVILAHLQRYHCSPQQIAGRLKRLFPDDKKLHVCPETIYRYVYRSSQREYLISTLRKKRKRRRKRKGSVLKRGGIKNKVSIHQRPTYVYHREEFGHWEGDLIIGKGQQSAMGTLVERSSRYLILIPLKARNSKTVVNAFIEAFSNLPDYMRKSLTYDQGSEMAEHERLREKVGMDVYFADAGQPQQRGTNENTNGLIREFFPKGIDLNQFDIKDTQEVQSILNQRPKKVLKYATAKEAFNWAISNPKAKLSEFKRQNNIF